VAVEDSVANGVEPGKILAWENVQVFPGSNSEYEMILYG
jgi:hypothetical protein